MRYVMSDSTFTTDFRPSCQLNADLQKKYNTSNGNDYRHYLQDNAVKIMKDLQNVTPDCKLCPVCSKSLDYKPSGNILTQ